MSDQKRNLNPHKAAIAAMFIFSDKYSRQTGGSMDFWDKCLTEYEKTVARALVEAIAKAPDETEEPPR